MRLRGSRSLCLSLLAACGLAIPFQATPTRADGPDEGFPTFAEARAAAVKGNVDAQFEVGMRYVTGYEVGRDFAQGLAWLRKAADQGSARAQHAIGMSYYGGRGVERDLAQAAAWWKKAADQGHASAQYWLGTAYEYGYGVPMNATEAARWFRLAADQGNGSAQSSLGDLYKQGRGVTQSDVEAVAWYRKSAEQKDASGQYEMAQMYAEGRGVKQDDTQAAIYFRLSSDQGFTPAMIDLAAAYEHGRGEVRNGVCAYFWLGLAAATEWDYAVEKRDAMAPRLTPAELAEARRLVEGARFDQDGNVERLLCPREEMTMQLENSDLATNVTAMQHLTGLKIEAPKDWKRKLSVNVTSTPWEDAFSKLLESGGLRWERNGDTIKIVPLQD
jgi:TPR repeat protein